MTTHTPGPWTNRHWNQHGSVRISSPNFSEPEMIAVYPRRDQYGFVIESSIDEAEANARLVAAAPELLSALKRLWESSRGEPVGKDGKDCWLVSSEALENAWRVIAKAQGDKP